MLLNLFWSTHLVGRLFLLYIIAPLSLNGNLFLLFAFFHQFDCISMELFQFLRCQDIFLPCPYHRISVQCYRLPSWIPGPCRMYFGPTILIFGIIQFSRLLSSLTVIHHIGCNRYVPFLQPYAYLHPRLHKFQLSTHAPYRQILLVPIRFHNSYNK